MTEVIERRGGGASLALIEVLDPQRPDSEMFQEWLALRQRYATERQWDVGPEGDEYDSDSRTFHLVARDPESHKLVAGMRLTPIEEEADTCMSWDMLGVKMRTQVKLGGLAALATPNSWDLTRLVSRESDVGRIVASEAVFALLGAGLKLTQRDEQDPDRDPRWFFTTTLDFFGAARRAGIAFHEIVSGVIPNSLTNDAEPETAFCYANPQTDTNNLATSKELRHTLTYTAVLRGMAAVAHSQMTGEAV